MKDLSLLIPAQISLTVANVGLAKLQIVAHLAGSEAKVVVEFPELIEPGALLVCLASIEHYLRQQTGADPEVQFAEPVAKAL